MVIDTAIRVLCFIFYFFYIFLLRNGWREYGNLDIYCVRDTNCISSRIHLYSILKLQGGTEIRQ